jgi:hypothetical protein
MTTPIPAPILERHDGVIVVREDLIPGGGKARLVPAILGDEREVVCGGPFCGGGPYALAIVGQARQIRVSLFYAQRRHLHPLQFAAQAAGATLHFVPYGYMTNVQARAREYAARARARFLPLGFDMPEAERAYHDVMRAACVEAGPVDEVWCATGSGLLARCLGRAFPEARVRAVAVSGAPQHLRHDWPANVEFEATPYRFEQPVKDEAPFPCHAYYDRKAWFPALDAAKRGARVLFWNVLW